MTLSIDSLYFVVRPPERESQLQEVAAVLNSESRHWFLATQNGQLLATSNGKFQATRNRQLQATWNHKLLATRNCKLLATQNRQLLATWM